jgi:iron complex outermembrane recepter protein
MKPIGLYILLLFASSLPLANAYEDNQLNVDEDDYIGDVPNVLSVSRLSQPKSDAPSAVTVIDREMIRASGIVDLPEIFRLVPGFYVGVNAGYVHNTNHVVSYHGMTSAYAGSMQILIDGRSVYSPLYGGVQWSELPLAIADIERIEVTRGPNAASYGANSYFGVINIITQHPSQVQGNTVIATYGNGRNEAFYRNGGKLGDLNYRITTGYRQDDGLDDRNDFKRTRLLNFRADYQVNNVSNVEFEFGLADGARGEGNVNEDPYVFLPRTKQISNHYELIRWRHNMAENSDFSLQAFHSFDRSNDATTSVNLRPIVDALLGAGSGALLLNDTITIKNLVETERYELEAQHNFSLGSDFRFVWGGSVRRDSMYAPFYLGTNKTDYFDLQRLFGHTEWTPHEKWLLNAGAMIEHNDFTGTDISPRVSVNFKVVPNHTLRIGASSALRTPNYLEEKFNRSLQVPTTLPGVTLLQQYDANLGNVDPERIISKEIGYLGKVGKVDIDARVFYDIISDYIDRRDTAFVAPPGLVLVTAPEDIEGAVNTGTAEVNGFETQVKWQVAKKTNLLFNFAHVRIRKTKEKLSKNYEQSMPSNTVSALLTHQFNQNWDASLAYYQTSEATLLGDGDPVDLIRKCDIRLARKFRAGSWDGEISAMVENLFNNHYEEFADYNTAKRRARLNVILNF